MIKILSFDFDGTIVTHRFADAFWLEGVPQLYAQQHHVPLEEAKHHLFTEYDAIGDNQVEWYDPAYWFNRFDLTTDYHDLLTQYIPTVELYPEVAAVLKRLSKHYPLIISSNAKTEFIDTQLNATGLRPYFTRIFSSTSDFHTVKKVTDFYDMVCTQLEIQPQELIHVGDHAQFDYQTPKQLGITAYHLDRTTTTTGPHIVHDLNQFEKHIKTTSSSPSPKRNTNISQ
ncbi:MAG: HAD family hydrolase [Candidatus Thermoplasmatota archaeon]|nr:HAD family hydrolase [Candidatus Thermoplasmatota archaeon]